MIDYYKHTRECIDKYNMLQDKIKTCVEETTDEEDELIINHMLYLAHALVKDIGTGKIAKDELCKLVDIIKDTCK